VLEGGREGGREGTRRKRAAFRVLLLFRNYFCTNYQVVAAGAAAATAAAAATTAICFL